MSSARKKIRNGPHAISACRTTLVKHALPTLTNPRGSHGSAAAAISAPRDTRSAASCARTAAAAVRPPNSTASAAAAAASSATTSGRPVDQADEGGSDTGGELRNGKDGLRAAADDAWGAEGEEVAADAAAAADALLAAAIAAHDRGAPPDAEALGVPGAGAGMAAGIVALADGEAAAPDGEAALTAGNTVAAGTGVVGGFCDDETLLLVLLA